MTIDLDELERKAKDWKAATGLLLPVEPDVVLALVERVREMEKRSAAVIEYIQAGKTHGGGMRAICERIEEMLK